MKISKLIASSLTAVGLVLAISGPAYADRDDRGHRGGHGYENHRQQHRGGDRGRDDRRHDYRGNDHRRHDYSRHDYGRHDHYRGNYYSTGHHYGGRGAPHYTYRHDLPRRHGGYWHHGWHAGRNGSWWIVGNNWQFYAPPVSIIYRAY
ncbi:hypothetical protein [Methylobacillus flagellatus]|uniref:hypothetical protein n=1 Tax=Methylobacillus flagellatus TaxID=405 RepID=UPI0010F7D241|nr:hypothetical protein [Methylobacillus flagellatus]